MKRFLLVAALAVPVVGCSDMSPTQQRALSGTAIGAGGGAVIGAIAGNAGMGALIGAGAGLAGGLIYDQVKRNEQSAYNRGVASGRAQSSGTSQ